MNTLLQFKFQEDILYFEGLLLSLGITEDNLPVLEIWCDQEDDYNLYAYAYIKHEDLEPFINEEKSYLEVLKNSKKIITFKYDGKAYDFDIIDNQLFISQYGPKEGFHLHDELIAFKEKFEVFKEKQH